MKYSQEQLVDIGVKMTESSGELPRCADLGAGPPSWRTIYTAFGSLPQYHEAINVKRGESHKAHSLITAGLRVVLETKKALQKSDLPRGVLTEEAIISVFGSFTDFQEAVSPAMPRVKPREDLVPPSQLLSICQGEGRKVTEKEFGLWASAGIFPRGFRSGRKGMYSLTLAPLVQKIRFLQAHGFSLSEVRDFMSIDGGYRNMTWAKCNEHGMPLGFKVKGSVDCLCTYHEVSINENRKKISLSDAVDKINQKIRNPNFHVTVRDMRRWTYDDGAEMNQKLIPDRLKVPGERSYLVGVVDLVVRIRELQSYNRKVEEIREILEEEYKAGMKKAMCFDCGTPLEGFSRGHVVCPGCAESVVYKQ